MSTLQIALVVIIVLVLIFVKKAIIIVPQSETRVIERLGKYYATLKPGVNIIIPFIDRPKIMVSMSRGRYTYKSAIDLREQVYDFARQNVITKDNIQMEINALLYFQIMDPFKAVYEINDLPNAIEKLTQTTLRNIIGEMELDQTLTSRDIINTKLRGVLDDATNKWGIKVNRVELQDIIPPQSVLNAMEKQMQAERNKRATILTSEGEKQAQILASEGEKTATINRAVRLRHASVRLRLRLWPLRKSRRLLASRQIRPTICLRRSTFRCWNRWPKETRPRQYSFLTRLPISWEVSEELRNFSKASNIPYYNRNHKGQDTENVLPFMV